MNLCVFKALMPQQFGEIQRMRITYQYDYTNRPPQVFTDDFQAEDQAWNGDRVSFVEQILLPDSLTGALFSGGVALGKVAVIAAYEAHFGWLSIRGWDLTMDKRIAPYLDPQGNMQSMNSRFNNLGTRPSGVRAIIEVCSDLCVRSQILSLQTR